MRPKRSSVLIGKTVRGVSRLRGGAGSALPGLVVEKIDKNFLKDCLSQLPKGVVVISGTNGKTTTTKIVVELLESRGLKVFTNRTGSNFVRGVIAALLEEIDSRGRLDADIAVLELDEAWAAKFVEIVRPRYSLLLNVMRDQLDRFHEIDRTAELLAKIAQATEGVTVINREDSRLVGVESPGEIRFYGLAEGLRSEFPSEDGGGRGVVRPTANVVLEALDGRMATFRTGRKSYRVKLGMDGVYNAYNAAGAITLALAILPDAKFSEFIPTLSSIRSAFGRGEELVVDGAKVRLVLVKNPAGFQLALKSFKADEVMIAVNDSYADGRDVSWLYDVDFSELPEEVAVVSGVRAADMALRLKYDNKRVGEIIPEFQPALKKLMARDGEKCIFATYTAMLSIRRLLSGKGIE